jgi:hypothetical protein
MTELSAISFRLLALSLLWKSGASALRKSFRSKWASALSESHSCSADLTAIRAEVTLLCGFVRHA